MNEEAAMVPSNAAPMQNEKQAFRLTERLGQEYGVDPVELVKFIKTNIISTKRGEQEATHAELFAVMTVMNQYGLNPWMKQLHAFRHDGKLHVSVGFDGWVALANRNALFQGVQYEYPARNEMVKTKGGLMCWPWVRAICHVANRVPTDVTVFLDEWYVQGRSGASNWDKYPTHRLRQKAYTMAVREAFGISLLDEADYEQIGNQAPAIRVATATDEKAAQLMDALGGKEPAPPSEEADPVEAFFEDIEQGGTDETGR